MKNRRIRLDAGAAALGVALVLGVSACEGDDASTTAGAPQTTATSTTQPQTETTPSQPSPEDQPGGAGDEAGARVPAVFTFTADGLRPATVAVPAFLAVQLTVVSRDGRAHQLTVLLPNGRQGLGVTAGGTVSTRVGGLRPGRYQVLADGRAAGLLIAGGEPGP